MNVDMSRLCDEGMSVDRIAGELGLPLYRVLEAERDALAKMAIGLTLVELLGHARSERVLATLRGRRLREWRQALREARAAAGGGGR